MGHLPAAAQQTVFLFYVVAFVFCAVYDVWFLKIPNLLVYIIAALFVPVAIAWYPPISVLIHVAVCAAALLVGGALFHFGHIGGGDAKLFAAAMLWAGAEFASAYLFAFGVISLLATVAVLLLRPLTLWLNIHLHLIVKDSRYFPKSLEAGATIPFGVPMCIASIWLATELPIFR